MINAKMIKNSVIKLCCTVLISLLACVQSARAVPVMCLRQLSYLERPAVQINGGSIRAGFSLAEENQIGHWIRLHSNAVRAANQPVVTQVAQRCGQIAALLSRSENQAALDDKMGKQLKGAVLDMLNHPLDGFSWFNALIENAQRYYHGSESALAVDLAQFLLDEEARGSQKELLSEYILRAVLEKARLSEQDIVILATRILHPEAEHPETVTPPQTPLGGVLPVFVGTRQRATAALAEAFAAPSDIFYVETGAPAQMVPGSDDAILQNITVNIQGRCAEGRVITINPQGDVEVDTYCNPAALTWDVIDQPRLEGAPLLRDFVADVQARERSEESDGQTIAVTCCLNTDMKRANGGLIQNGELLRKANGARGVAQPVYEPLNGLYTYFVIDKGHPGIQTADIQQGSLRTMGIERALSGPALLRGGADVSHDIKFELNSSGDAVNWPPEITNASFAAIGKKPDGSIVILCLYGDASRAPELLAYDMARIMQRLGVEDAVLLEGSGGVKGWFGGEDFMFAKARPGTSTLTVETGLPQGRPFNTALVIRRMKREVIIHRALERLISRLSDPLELWCASHPEPVKTVYADFDRTAAPDARGPVLSRTRESIREFIKAGGRWEVLSGRPESNITPRLQPDEITNGLLQADAERLQVHGRNGAASLKDLIRERSGGRYLTTRFLEELLLRIAPSIPAYGEDPSGPFKGLFVGDGLVPEADPAITGRNPDMTVANRGDFGLYAIDGPEEAQVSAIIMCAKARARAPEGSERKAYDPRPQMIAALKKILPRAKITAAAGFGALTIAYAEKADFLRDIVRKHCALGGNAQDIAFMDDEDGPGLALAQELGIAGLMVGKHDASLPPAVIQATSQGPAAHDRFLGIQTQRLLGQEVRVADDRELSMALEGLAGGPNQELARQAIGMIIKHYPNDRAALNALAQQQGGTGISGLPEGLGGTLKAEQHAEIDGAEAI